MRKILKTLLFWALCLIPFAFTQAQSATSDSDIYQSSGKIYVVVAVIGLIFVGLIGFLVWLDMRVSRLEKRQDK